MSAQWRDRSSAGGPVLGRYTPKPGDASRMCTVRLLHLPIGLFLRAREHHDDLVREFTLMAIGETEDAARREAHSASDNSRPALPPRLRELVDILGRRLGATASRADAERDAAIARGDATVDLSYEVSTSIASDLVTLTDLLDDADEFCRTERLLTLPRDPDMVRFGHWYNNEFLRQFDGHEPTAWTGVLV
jgi:hypothetical protein